MLIGIDASRVNITHRTGTENYAYNVIYHLARLESQHTFRLYFRNQPDTEFWNELTNGNSNWQYKVIPWPRLWTQGGLALELLLNPVDVVFISSHTMPVLHRPSQKFVVTIHGLEYMYMKEYERFPHKLYLTKSTEFVSRFADRIIAVSEFTKKSLLEHGWGATEERITVVPEGVRTDHFSPRGEDEVASILQKYEIMPPYIFFISTIQPRKNVVGLLEAFALLHEEIADGSGSGTDTEPWMPNQDFGKLSRVVWHDKGDERSVIPAKAGIQAVESLESFSRRSASGMTPQLVLAGGHGHKFEEVEATILRFGLQDTVKVLGRVPDEDVPALFSGATASVYPSFVEGFGLPVLESMACGAPVVCSNTGALPEVGGDSAMYVDPYDVESIMQGLREALANDDTRTERIEKGLEHVKNFSWKETARQIMQVFEEMSEPS